MTTAEGEASHPPGRARPAATGCLYLSFDDGPDPRWTPRILDLLAQAQARATFFMVGCRALAHAALARRVAAAGHVLGNHTYSHLHPWTLASAAARREVRDGAAALADLTGVAPRWFRPPYGRLRRCMLDEAERGGQRLVLWNRSVVDWGLLGRARWIARRLAAAGPGEIVLMHDGARGSNRPGELVEVLPGFLADLGRRGLALVALPEAAPSPASSADRAADSPRTQR